MRTTLEIPDDVFRKLKVKAAVQGETLKTVALRGILREVDEQEAPPLQRLSEPILRSYAPGSIDIDNEGIYDLIGFP